MHRVQTSLQDLLKPHIMILLPTDCLLGSRILMTPLRAFIRNRHIRLLLAPCLLPLRLLDAGLAV